MKRLSKRATSRRDHQAASKDDAAWFKANPDRSHRLRRPYDVELRETMAPAATPASAIPYVVARQVCPGFRLRMLIWSDIEVPDTEAIGHALFDLSTKQTPGQPLPMAKVAALQLEYARGGRA
ncbi:hypothetical protein JL101_013280 [Skermanella rosea]|uniref:hypothetical protein n=1 Tax=Skermanella rosea TaxID=1817965 RepID=UPI001931AE9A|nr:hypothetical protein [Skermanella rosea]UEM06357.1 hypothetical protein JL101_013280 [Skermanella rosea]